jgi:zinc protease
MKNVFLMTATEDEQLGYALDSQWYGMGEFTAAMRDRLSKLTLADVNGGIKKHLSGQNLSVVIIAKDAKDLRDRLTSDAPSSIKYDAPKPPDVVEEDKVISVLKLQPTSVTITPVDQVFAK